MKPGIKITMVIMLTLRHQLISLEKSTYLSLQWHNQIKKDEKQSYNTK